jgi:hypothetical protein
VNVSQDDARGDSSVEQYGPVLPFWRKLAYSTGAIGDNLPFNTASFYLFFFLTSLPANARMSPLDAGILVGCRQSYSSCSIQLQGSCPIGFDRESDTVASS